MVRSMTSFGRASNEEGNKYLFSVEMKSVNSRYLDINVRMPKGIIALEEEIRKMINETLSRGKVDVFINAKSYEGAKSIARLNLELAQSYLECLKTIEDSMDIKNDISVMKIARFPEVVIVQEEEDSIEEIWEIIKPLINEAVCKMVDMREVEGEKLKKDILEKLIYVENIVSEIERNAYNVPMAYKKKLEARLNELIDKADIDEARIALEVAILADKSAVDEEITRLRSHVFQMRKTLGEDGAIGRKLDFIIQEMNREANTIASKSSDIHMTNNVIDIKNLIEKIREQTQNIE